MKSGEELALGAMKKELVRLSRAAERAKVAVDEAIAVGSEYVDIHQEFAALLQSGLTGADALERLAALQARRDRADKIMKKDLLKLIDKQHETEMARDELGREIHQLEWRRSMKPRQGRP